MTSELEDLIPPPGWIPVNIRLGADPKVVWRDLSGATFSEPFFGQTVNRYEPVGPGAGEAVTGLDALLIRSRGVARVVPTALVFHASRCGSTAISNAFRQLDNAFVISEAQPVNAVVAPMLRKTGHAPGDVRLWASILKATVDCIGSAAQRPHAKLFIKFTSWNILAAETIRSLWPDVPAVFSYRDPAEIVPSLVKRPPDWLNSTRNDVLLQEITGIPGPALGETSIDDLAARATGRFLEAALTQLDKGIRLIDYAELNLAGILELLKNIGVDPTSEEGARIESSLKYYSKDQTAPRPFEPDSQRKISSLTTEMKQAIECFAIRPYQTLRELRRPKLEA